MQSGAGRTSDETSASSTEQSLEQTPAQAPEKESAARLGRRRRANVVGGRHHVHKVKVTPEEEALLGQLALRHGGITIPRLLVEAALAGDAETATERRAAIQELFAVYRLLAAVSNNLNQLARATNATHEVQAELSATLEAVRRTAGRIDDTLDAISLG